MRFLIYVAPLFFIFALCTCTNREPDSVFDALDKMAFEVGPGMKPAKAPMLKFIVAGQSNASARAAERDLPAYSLLGHTYITRFTGNTFDLTTTYVPTQDNPVPAAFPWLKLGDLLYIMYGQDTLFFNIAEGSTSSQTWRDRLYTRFETALRGPAADAQAVLWIQGESDFFENRDPVAYYDNIVFMIKETLRIKPDLIWFLAPTTSGEISNGIRKMQLKLIENGWALAGPDYDELRKNPDFVDSDRVHFTGNGHSTVATLWLKIIQDAIR